jgi:hypothetical protein
MIAAVRGGHGGVGGVYDGAGLGAEERHVGE